MRTIFNFCLEQVGNKEENKVQDKHCASTLLAELCSQSTDTSTLLSSL